MTAMDLLLFRFCGSFPELIKKLWLTSEHITVLLQKGGLFGVTEKHVVHMLEAKKFWFDRTVHSIDNTVYYRFQRGYKDDYNNNNNNGNNGMIGNGTNANHHHHHQVTVVPFTKSLAASLVEADVFHVQRYPCADLMKDVEKNYPELLLARPQENDFTNDNNNASSTTSLMRSGRSSSSSSTTTTTTPTTPTMTTATKQLVMTMMTTPKKSFKKKKKKAILIQLGTTQYNITTSEAERMQRLLSQARQDKENNVVYLELCPIIMGEHGQPSLSLLERWWDWIMPHPPPPPASVELHRQLQRDYDSKRLYKTSSPSSVSFRSLTPKKKKRNALSPSSSANDLTSSSSHSSSSSQDRGGGGDYTLQRLSVNSNPWGADLPSMIVTATRRERDIISQAHSQFASMLATPSCRENLQHLKLTLRIIAPETLRLITPCVAQLESLRYLELSGRLDHDRVNDVLSPLSELIRKIPQPKKSSSSSSSSSSFLSQLQQQDQHQQQQRQHQHQHQHQQQQQQQQRRLVEFCLGPLQTLEEEWDSVTDLARDEFVQALIHYPPKRLRLGHVDLKTAVQLYHAATQLVPRSSSSSSSYHQSHDSSDDQHEQQQEQQQGHHTKRRKPLPPHQHDYFTTQTRTVLELHGSTLLSVQGMEAVTRYLPYMQLSGLRIHGGPEHVAGEGWWWWNNHDNHPRHNDDDDHGHDHDDHDVHNQNDNNNDNDGDLVIASHRQDGGRRWNLLSALRHNFTLTDVRLCHDNGSVVPLYANNPEFRFVLVRNKYMACLRKALLRAATDQGGVMPTSYFQQQEEQHLWQLMANTDKLTHDDDGDDDNDNANNVNVDNTFTTPRFDNNNDDNDIIDNNININNNTKNYHDETTNKKTTTISTGGWIKAMETVGDRDNYNALLCASFIRNNGGSKMTPYPLCASRYDWEQPDVFGRPGLGGRGDSGAVAATPIYCIVQSQFQNWIHERHDNERKKIELKLLSSPSTSRPSSPTTTMNHHHEWSVRKKTSSPITTIHNKQQQQQQQQQNTNIMTTTTTTTTKLIGNGVVHDDATTTTTAAIPPTLAEEDAHDIRQRQQLKEEDLRRRQQQAATNACCVIL